MDIIDSNILKAMKKNGRATASEISKKVNLSIPAVSERIRKLEDGNIIEQYTVRLNREKMGYKLLVTIFVDIDQTSNIKGFRETIIKYSEVIECYHIVGEYDYMLKVLLKDSSELEDFIGNKLKSIKGVKRSNTILMLSTLKEEINR
ncbi:Lrp/AsnC family transcriptional regulator [Tepidibacter hydrothermalis]|uniref:Lrp/AsnC family transcriptional regulator n=1 Tax=Tepidibacter hydrothermalis TaxID=3036126 RepID=A0ABY8EG31_9FIRM|nr:Lrp/AsnC family transcriptional regulator [Tepidibacter hydrothermalis]WFD11891.1 Lrp/AsnC family transcriptional regulator [Tepidibacter hydrothermalis]